MSPVVVADYPKKIAQEIGDGTIRVQSVMLLFEHICSVKQKNYEGLGKNRQVLKDLKFLPVVVDGATELVAPSKVASRCDYDLVPFTLPVLANVSIPTDIASILGINPSPTLPNVIQGLKKRSDGTRRLEDIHHSFRPMTKYFLNACETVFENSKEMIARVLSSFKSLFLVDRFENPENLFVELSANLERNPSALLEGSFRAAST